MRGDLKVGTWAEIDDGCPVTYTFDGDDNVSCTWATGATGSR